MPLRKILPMILIMILILIGILLALSFAGDSLAAESPDPAARAALESRLVRLADDPDPRVRMQAAFALGEARSPERIQALAKIARRDAADRWTRTAVLSSVPDDALALYQAVAAEPGFASAPGMPDFVNELAGVIGARLDATEVAGFLAALASAPAGAEPIQAAALKGLGEGLKLGEGKKIAIADAEAPLAALATSPAPAVREAAAKVSALISPDAGNAKSMQVALAAAIDESRPLEARVAAIESLRGARGESAWRGLAGLLDPRQPEEIQLAAIGALDAAPGLAIGDWLIPRWRGFAPKARDRALAAVFARKERIPSFLAAIEAGEIPASGVDAPCQSQLLAFPDPTIAGRAKALFGPRDAGEMPLLEKYKTSLDLPGDRDRGAAIHKDRCAQCHRVGQVGSDVGPAWAGIKSNPPEKILLNILYPSQSVAAGFGNYMVETEGGRLATGLVVASTPASVTLRRGGGEEETILRKNIKAMTESALSMMPEGLDDGLSAQAMADLLAFVLAAD